MRPTMSFELGRQCCDAVDYLVLGGRCARDAARCWDPLRPIGATLYFSLPERLGWPSSSIAALNLALAAASAAIGWVSLGRLLGGRPIVRGAQAVAIAATYVFFMWEPAWNSLADVPAAALALVAFWLLLASRREGMARHVGAGLALGGAVSLRAFYLYPALAAAVALVGLSFWPRQAMARAPAAAAAFTAVLLAPILLQAGATHARTGRWAFLDPEIAEIHTQIHFKTTAYGYDTIASGPATHGLPYEAPECFRRGEVFQKALNTGHLRAVACLLARRQYFYFGSFAGAGRVYLGTPGERHFSPLYLGLSVAGMIAGLAVAFARTSGSVALPPLVLAVALWAEGSVIRPEGRFLMVTQVALWALALAGTVSALTVTPSPSRAGAP
jgi:hypothetical protein